MIKTMNKYIFPNQPEARIKYNSPDDIRIALGLKPWDEWRLTQIKHFLNRGASHVSTAEALDFIDNKRATGRTTKLLIEAVHTAQTHKVLMMGRTTRHSEDLTEQAIEMCRKLKLDSAIKKIKPVVFNGDKIPFILISGDSKLFVDHTVEFKDYRRHPMR